jgi:hypothetical protein
MPTVVCAIVSTSGFAHRPSNASRIDLAVEIAVAAQVLGAELVALPAGYLRAKDEPEAQQLALTLASIFDQVNVAVVASASSPSDSRSRSAGVSTTAGGSPDAGEVGVCRRS